MKMIDDYIDAFIRTDEKGNTIFLQYGALTRGKTIPSEQAGKELREFLRKWAVGGLILLVVAVPFGFMTGSLHHDYGVKSWLVLAIPVLLLLAHYQVRIDRILKGAQTSGVRVTADELGITIYPTWAMWFFVICFGSLLPLYVRMVFCDPVWENIVKITSAGAFWLAFLILLIKKRRNGGADSPTTASV